MLPSPESNNVVDALLRHAELVGNMNLSHSGHCHRSDITYNIVRQCGVAMSHTTLLTTFSNLVNRVCGRSAKKQMGGIDARRIIAGVQHMQSIRDGAVMEFPRDAMRQQDRAVYTARSNTPVAVATNSSGPYPAITGCVNFRPESFSDGAAATGILTGHRTVLSSGDMPGMFIASPGVSVPLNYTGLEAQIA